MSKASPEEKSFKADFRSMSFKDGKVSIKLSNLEFVDFLKVGLLCGKGVIVRMEDAQGNLFDKEGKK